jgi:hypothetical protein
MTYRFLKNLTKGLLIGDNQLPIDEDQMIALVAYAYEKIANEADAMKLLSALDSGDVIIRQGPGGTYIRRPKLPENDDSELDIDDDLVFPTSRFLASFISRERGGIHVNEANHLIRQYNAKIRAQMETNWQKDDEREEIE